MIGPEEKERVAVHEAGHALVALSVKHADPLHRISIIPRSIGALGYTLQLPTQERYLMTEPSWKIRSPCFWVGGRQRRSTTAAWSPQGPPTI